MGFAGLTALEDQNVGGLVMMVYMTRTNWEEVAKRKDDQFRAVDADRKQRDEEYKALEAKTKADTDALRLPTFAVEGRTYVKRLTLVIHEGVIEHVFYPVFPPNANAGEVIRWLSAHPLPA